VDPPDYAKWRTTVQLLTDAGVLFVCATGENDQFFHAPTNVPVPARAPAALAVGSIGTNSLDFEISEFSSKGPVTWMNVTGFMDYPYPPGLLKPDLVAPGEGVLSVKKGGGYTSGFTGVSFATPFVSGVAALLLGRNMNLTPYDLRFILEETAFHTTHATNYPNPRYGWGRVDAAAAVNYLQTNWTNVTATAYNLTVSNGGLKQTNGITLIYASVTNTGGEVVGNVEMRFYCTNDLNVTTKDLDPNGDGDPEDSKLGYIGSYFVPVVGPKGSKHETFQGFVLWQPPPQFTQGRFGVWVRAGATARAEQDTTDNGIVFTASSP
jgi:subtilisin family serine protease